MAHWSVLLLVHPLKGMDGRVLLVRLICGKGGSVELRMQFKIDYETGPIPEASTRSQLLIVATVESYIRDNAVDI